MTPPNPPEFFIVGIGASAGGVQPIEQFFASLPDGSNAAFVVVQHLSPDHKSMMNEIVWMEVGCRVEGSVGRSRGSCPSAAVFARLLVLESFEY